MDGNTRAARTSVRPRREWTTYYDAAGNVRFTVDPRSVEAPEPIVSEREYEWGRVKRIVGAQVDESPLSRPTTELFHTQAGDVREMVDPLLRTTQYSVDNLGQVWSVTLPPVGARVPCSSTSTTSPGTGGRSLIRRGM